MVTAGIFMVARMSPLYELSETALATVMIIGAITALFMGLIGIVQNDIKRVVAYSTLSQLGYMTVALGVSAYSAAVFHLMTHAFFKALLFLAAGSVIIAMHHEQDMRKMGGLRKYMPITWITSLIGSLALIGFPGFSGFFSKDSIILAVGESTLPGASIVYWMVMAGVFITAFYSFRMYFMVFHGKERMDQHTREHLHETPWVVTLPLIALAIPSVIIGWMTIEPMLFGDYFVQSIQVNDAHNVLAALGENYHGQWAMVEHGIFSLPFLLAMSGVVLAWYIYLKQPSIADAAQQKFAFVYRMLDKKYWIDELYVKVFSDGSRGLGKGFWKGGDSVLIDGLLVNGSARLVGWFAGVIRHMQTGMLYHYAFAMIIGLVGLLYLFVDVL
jgi:NADH-quinone oxidoreductase subunit L